MAYKKYPLLLKPVCKEIIWGGDRLKKHYNKVCDLAKLAETWELTTRGDGMSVIANGECEGMTLGDYLGGEVCPLLIKFIDARDDLSIQVHPADEYALANEGEFGKTEMWYIVEADEGARIVYGTKRAFTREEFVAAVEAGALEELMNYTPVKAGDIFFIPSGLVHAIGSGCLIAEIQQNSNITYRVYDYNRRQPDGSLRQLHVEKALDVIRHFTEDDIEAIRYEKGRPEGAVASCKYFTVSKFKGDAEIDVCCDFAHLLCLGGTGSITGGNVTVEIAKGDSIYLPAGIGKVSVKGDAELILSRA